MNDWVTDEALLRVIVDLEGLQPRDQLLWQRKLDNSQVQTTVFAEGSASEIKAYVHDPSFQYTLIGWRRP